MKRILLVLLLLPNPYSLLQTLLGSAFLDFGKTAGATLVGACGLEGKFARGEAIDPENEIINFIKIDTEIDR